MMKSFDIMGVHLKIRIHPPCLKKNLGEEGAGELRKKWGLDSLQI